MISRLSMGKDREEVSVKFFALLQVSTITNDMLDGLVRYTCGNVNRHHGAPRLVGLVWSSVMECESVVERAATSRQRNCNGLQSLVSCRRNQVENILRSHKVDWIKPTEFV